MLPSKNFLFFTRRERLGTLLLAMCIVAALLVTRLVGKGEEERLTAVAEAGEGLSQRADSLHRRVSGRLRVGQERKMESGSEAEPALTPFAFNPNRADSATLCRLGLPGWMARNVVRYRERGGQFRKREDFRRIYGMTEERYRILEPYIRIEATDGDRAGKAEARSVPERDTASLIVPPTVPPEASVQKYPPGTVVSLNRADTAELKRIPGIGSAIARRIVAYRTRLGGFYDVGQLSEISLDAERLRPWLEADAAAIRTLPLNRASVNQLRSHPYVSFYQARAIVEQRRKSGRIGSLKELSLLEEFTPAELERLAHYVDFE